MSALHKRQRPAGTGREVEQQINFGRSLYGGSDPGARDGYRGVRPRPTAPAARDPAVIAGDLRAAADHLGALADDFAAGVFDARALSSADALLIGAGRLICELRQRQGGGA